MASAFRQFFKRHTPAASAITGFGVFAAGDAISQVLEWHEMSEHERESAPTSVSWMRIFKMGTFGAALNGIGYLHWYKGLDKAFGTSRSNFGSVVKKTVADQLIMAPFAITTCLMWAATMEGTTNSEAVARVTKHLPEAWIMDCQVWPLANLFAFRMVPTMYRPSFIGFVQVGWQTYMSSVAHRDHAAKTVKIAEPTEVLTVDYMVPVACCDGMDAPSTPSGASQ